MSSVQHAARLESLVSHGTNVLAAPKTIPTETVAAMKGAVAGLSRSQKQKMKRAAKNADAAAQVEKIKELETEIATMKGKKPEVPKLESAVGNPGHRVFSNFVVHFFIPAPKIEDRQEIGTGVLIREHIVAPYHVL